MGTAKVCFQTLSIPTVAALTVSAMAAAIHQATPPLSETDLAVAVRFELERRAGSDTFSGCARGEAGSADRLRGVRIRGSRTKG